LETMTRKKPYSGKKKKEQLKAKRQRKRGEGEGTNSRSFLQILQSELFILIPHRETEEREGIHQLCGKA